MSVYFLQAGGPTGAIKIGYTSRNPHQRLRELQDGNPFDLALLAVMPGGRKQEQELLRRYRPHHLRGEWFSSAPELLGFIEGMVRAYPEIPAPPPEPEAIVAGFEKEQRHFIEGRMLWVMLRADADAALLALGIPDISDVDPDSIGDTFLLPLSMTDMAGLLPYVRLLDRLTRYRTLTNRGAGKTQEFILGLLGEDNDLSRYIDMFDAIVESPYRVPLLQRDVIG